MIRKLIQIVCGPLVEPLLTRMGRGVTIGEHAILIYRLQKNTDRLQIHLQKYVSSRSLDLEHLFNCNLFETCHELQLIQLADFMDVDIIDKDHKNQLVLKLKDLVQSALSWEGSRLDIARARIVSGVVFFGFKRGAITGEQAISVVSKFTNALPAEAWFSSRGMLYGASYLLRILPVLCQMGYSGTFSKYTENVYERLLRSVEIKRRTAFQFQNNSIPLDASCILEQLRLTLAMLEAAEFFSDVRYLNAALKMNDWNYVAINKLKIYRMKANNFTTVIHCLYYSVAISKQEELFVKLCQN